MIGQEILQEIDSTLDQLIRNAEIIQNVDLKELSESEMDGFQKTQDSLIQHLLHMDQFLSQKKDGLKVPEPKSAGATIQQKLFRFERLKTAYHKSIKEIPTCKTAILLKRRNKRLLEVDQRP